MNSYFPNQVLLCLIETGLFMFLLQTLRKLLLDLICLGLSELMVYCDNIILCNWDYWSCYLNIKPKTTQCITTLESYILPVWFQMEPETTSCFLLESSSSTLQLVHMSPAEVSVSPRTNWKMPRYPGPVSTVIFKWEYSAWWGVDGLSQMYGIYL